MRGESLRYFRPLTMEAKAESWVDYLTVSLVRRVAFTAIGVIMTLWAWSLLASQIAVFPNIDPVTVLIGLFTIILGIRNILSIIRDVTWGQAFLTLAFVAVMAYIVWFV